MDRLARLSYTHYPSPDDVEYPFFHRPTGWPHTHHVHLCVPDSGISSSNASFIKTLALIDEFESQTDLFTTEPPPERKGDRAR